MNFLCFRGLKGLTSIVLGGLLLAGHANAHPAIGEELSMQAQDSPVIVPIGGNTWRSGEERRGGRVSNNGIESWTSSEVSFTTYVRVAQKGSLKLSLHLGVPDGSSKIQVSIAKHPREINVSGADAKDHDAGEWAIADTGYVAIHIKGISKTGEVFANIESLRLEGSAINERTDFVKSNEGNYFYWGRRGPSVHLNYSVPDDLNVEWFYNEVTVPPGNDVIGSYFMADGFGEGYFGMQVNSPTERHILFSVWSPYSTDDPKSIPDDQKIQLLKKGEGVHTGEFGNEGSGGQSYMNYPWKAGTTYRFLLHGKPDGPDHTIYTAYFYAPEKGKWLLIASFRRPKTHTWLKHLYSFLENFSPDQGDKERQVLFGNQWVRSDEGKWMELNNIRFTADNTARKAYRMDYSGGVKGSRFYLRNCGFFSDYTPIDTLFERPLNGKQPAIDLQGK